MKENGRVPRKLMTRLIALVLASVSTAALVFGCAGDYARKRAEHYYLQGQALVNRGETERAIKKFEKSMYLAKKTGFTAGIAHNLNELAIIDSNQGKFDEAKIKLDQALGIYRAEKMNTEISKTLNNFVQVYLKEGRFEDAIEHYKKLITWDQKSGNRIGMAFSLWNMALIYDRNLGEHKKARIAREWALEILQEPGNEKYLEQLRGRE